MNFIDSGSKPKHGPTLTIDFSVEFETAPVVLVSSFWDGSDSEVGHAETIRKITQTGFQVISGNQTPPGDLQPYKVNWIAIGVPKKKD